jgi:hypothetical protein
MMAVQSPCSKCVFACIQSSLGATELVGLLTQSAGFRVKNRKKVGTDFINRQKNTTKHRDNEHGPERDAEYGG